jgi:hypothetical protein
MPVCSGREHCSYSFQNLATSSSTTSTRKVLSGERPSTNFMVEVTTDRSVASSLTISVWQRVAIHIPSDRCFLTHGRPTMARHSSEPWVYSRGAHQNAHGALSQTPPTTAWHRPLRQTSQWEFSSATPRAQCTSASSALRRVIF